MTKDDVDFDVWFDCFTLQVLDRTGVKFRDADSVRADYESGADLFDVVDEIAAEYEIT